MIERLEGKARTHAELGAARRVIAVQGNVSALSRGSARAQRRDAGRPYRLLIEQAVEEFTPVVATPPACRIMSAAPATIYWRRPPLIVTADRVSMSDRLRAHQYQCHPIRLYPATDVAIGGGRERIYAGNK